MKAFNKLIAALLALSVISCNNDREIISLLKSENPNDVILGAYKAGETGEKKFAPLLLNNCSDRSSSTNIHFKGFTVYQEKMIALQKIFKKTPPVKVTSEPDSTIINFYLGIFKGNK
jgi:hypothetical protein